MTSPSPEENARESVNDGMTADEVYEHLAHVHGLGPFPRAEDEVLFLAHAQRHGETSRPARWHQPLFPHDHGVPS